MMFCLFQICLQVVTSVATKIYFIKYFLLQVNKYITVAFALAICNSALGNSVGYPGSPAGFFSGSHAGGAAYGAYSPVAPAPHVPVAPAVPVEPELPAHYQFGYSVGDPHSGDFKSQVETADGHSVKVSQKYIPTMPYFRKSSIAINSNRLPFLFVVKFSVKCHYTNYISVRPQQIEYNKKVTNVQKCLILFLRNVL